eukprot:5185459-Pyramimonas_sp.AAC.1
MGAGPAAAAAAAAGACDGAAPWPPPLRERRGAPRSLLRVRSPSPRWRPLSSLSFFGPNAQRTLRE